MHVIACCCMLLRLVSQSLKPVELLSQQLPTLLLFRDCLHSSSIIVGATHAPRWLSNLNLQSLMGCILSTMLCRPQHYIVESCCIRLHTTANTGATTPNIVGPTVLGVVVSVCTRLRGKTKEKVITEEGRSTNNVYRDIRHARTKMRKPNIKEDIDENK